MHEDIVIALINQFQIFEECKVLFWKLVSEFLLNAGPAFGQARDSKIDTIRLERRATTVLYPIGPHLDIVKKERQGFLVISFEAFNDTPAFALQSQHARYTPR